VSSVDRFVNAWNAKCGSSRRLECFAKPQFVSALSKQDDAIHGKNAPPHCSITRMLRNGYHERTSLSMQVFDVLKASPSRFVRRGGASSLRVKRFFR
jgi:hypothetical protein